MSNPAPGPRLSSNAAGAGRPDPATLRSIATAFAAAADDFAKTGEERQILELVYSQGLFGRPYVLPPGVPAERVAALRQAFTAALNDKTLLEEAAGMKLDIDAISGDYLQALVAKLYALPPSVAARAKEALVYTPPK